MNGIKCSKKPAYCDRNFSTLFRFWDEFHETCLLEKDIDGIADYTFGVNVTSYDDYHTISITLLPTTKSTKALTKPLQT